jgi:hypothetical protein
MKPWLVLFMALPLGAQDNTQASQPAAPAAPSGNADPSATEPRQTITGNVDLGYRWLSGVGGDLQTYRSVVDMGSGVRLLGLDLTVETAARKWLDRVNVRGSGWGGDPYNTAHVDAVRHDWYNFSFDYRNFAYFNFLPSYADPTIGSGVYLDQRSLDTHRRIMDFELDLAPGRWIVPYLGYSHDSGSGTGITDFVNGLNSYPVSNRPRDKTDNFRGGIRMERKKFHITVEQGGTLFKDDQEVFTNNLNFGNSIISFFGQQLFLSKLIQEYGIRGDSIYTRVLGTANATPWLDLFGSYLYSRGNTNVNYTQYNVGQFIDLDALLLYTSELALLNGAARQPHNSGTLGFELRPARRLRMIESWMTDRLSNRSSATQNQQILTPTPTTLLTDLTSELVVNYNREQIEALFDLTSRITLRGGYRYEWGNGLTQGALIFGPPTETGQVKRQVALAGASYRTSQGLSASLDFERSGGDLVYFRTGLLDYVKARGLARYQVKPSLIVGGGFSVLHNQNPAPSIQYDYLSHDESVSVTWNPDNGKLMTVTGDYTRATIRSNINYIVPQNFTTATSIYRDNAHEASALVDLVVPGFGVKGPRLGFGGWLLRTSGSRPTDYYQPIVRFTTPAYKHVNWFGEWRYYGFGEPFYLFEGFRSHLLTVGLRFTP